MNPLTPFGTHILKTKNYSWASPATVTVRIEQETHPEGGQVILPLYRQNRFDLVFDKPNGTHARLCLVGRPIENYGRRPLKRFWIMETIRSILIYQKRLSCSETTSSTVGERINRYLTSFVSFRRPGKRNQLSQIYSIPISPQPSTTAERWKKGKRPVATMHQ